VVVLGSVPPEPLQLLPYYLTDRSPLLRAGMVLSADGAATSDGSSRPLSGPADRAVFRLLRALSDVVLVGAGTARSEDYGPVPLPRPLLHWRRDAGLPERPRLAVVTATGALDPASRLFSGDLPTLVLAPRAVAGRCRDALPRAEVVDTGPGDLAHGLAALRERGLCSVLCEGGPHLLGDLVRAGLVDELCATVSPLLAGAGERLVAGALDAPAPLVLQHALESAGELLLRYSLGRPAC